MVAPTRARRWRDCHFGALKGWARTSVPGLHSQWTALPRVGRTSISERVPPFLPSKVSFISSLSISPSYFPWILGLPIPLLLDTLACTRSKLSPLATYDHRSLYLGINIFFVPVPGYNTIVPLFSISPTILVHRKRESASINRSLSSQGPISLGYYYLIKLCRVTDKGAKKKPFEYSQSLLHDIFPQTVRLLQECKNIWMVTYYGYIYYNGE